MSELYHVIHQNEGLLAPGMKGTRLANVTTSSKDHFLGDLRPSSPIPAIAAPSATAMDLAYDHIQEEALKQEQMEKGDQTKPESTLNDDFQEAYRAISSSPWGAKLGGFFGNVVKQVRASPYLDIGVHAEAVLGRVGLQRSSAGAYGGRRGSFQGLRRHPLINHQAHTSTVTGPGSNRDVCSGQRWRGQGEGRFYRGRSGSVRGRHCSAPCRGCQTIEGDREG